MNDVAARYDRKGRRPSNIERPRRAHRLPPLKDAYAPDSFATDALDETHLLLAYAASAGINIES